MGKGMKPFSQGGALSVDHARQWARSVARKWGPVKVQEMVKAGDLPGQAWKFICESHGGYVLIAKPSDVPPCFHNLASGARETWVAFVFEQDFNRVIFEAAYQDVCRWWADKIRKDLDEACRIPGNIRASLAPSQNTARQKELVKAFSARYRPAEPSLCVDCGQDCLRRGLPEKVGGVA